MSRKTAMIKVTPTQNICTIPAEFTGAVDISIQSSNSVDPLYTVAQGSVTLPEKSVCADVVLELSTLLL